MKYNEFILFKNQMMQIFAREWYPDKETRAVIVLVHGLSDHSGRYYHMAEYFTNRGIGIISPDLYGNGKSSGKRGHLPNEETYIRIIDESIKRGRANYINLPIFLYGHSMGGEIVLWYCIQRKPNINGVITTAPLFVTHVAPNPIKLILAKVMDKIYPAFSMSDGIDANVISRDKNVVSTYISDPLVHGRVTARQGWIIIHEGKWLLEHAQEFPLPLLIMVGKGEALVDRVSIDQFAKKAPNVDYKIWDSLFHELHNEPEKEKIFDYELEWLSKHC